VRTAPSAINTLLLLSDGTVMAASDTTMNVWYRLTPDGLGSYVNGTWSSLPSMAYTRLYYSSDVLTNGKVFFAGAEYGTGTNSAEVFDPVNNTWLPCPPPPTGQRLFYDSVSKILPNGNVLIAPVSPATSGGTVLYVTASNTWANGGTLFRGSYQDEASWVKLPDDSILTIDPFGTSSERYIPSLNQWINDATVPVSLYDSFGFELGAGFLLPDGRAFYLGSTGKTAFYTPTGNTNRGSWQAGPVIPNGQGTPDAPAAMMVNGNILCAVSPVPTSGNHFPTPTSFYEYDPVTNAFTRISGPTGLTFSSPPYVMRMLDLPDGSVLLAVASSQLFVYRPDGAPLAVGQPAISNLTQNADGSFHLAGTLFNGICEGAAYGDDAQMDSNYPLVRMTNSASGNVYYARTFGWNSTSVRTGNRLVSTEFSLPAGLPSADYSLVAVANGNSSGPVAFSTATLPPVIVTQPRDQTVVVTGSATFKVGAAGTPLNYSWLRDGNPLAGATTSTYSMNNVQFADSGAQFSCLVSNVNGTTLSSNAVLVTGFPPSITAQPTNQIAPIGGSATFSVTATSSVAIAYLWRRGGVAIAGSTASSYTTNNVQLNVSGAQFSCQMSNIFGVTNSSSATLTVMAVPTNDLCAAAFVITNFPYTNIESTLVATTNGDPVPSCVNGFGKGVWYVFTAPSSGTVVADTLGSSFSTGLAAYTGVCGSLTEIACDDGSGGSLAARITTLVTGGVPYHYLAGGYNGASGNVAFHLNFTSSDTPPVITVQPTNLTVALGSSATFSVTATGATPLSYYWQRGGSFIAGATDSACTINNVQVSDSGSLFSCLVSNALGTALSSNALLTVNNNLVQNAGFELGTFAFWTTNGQFANSSVSSGFPYVHSGAYGARLGPVGSLGYISQALPTSMGQLYQISFWLYSDGSTPNEFQMSWDGNVLFDQLDISATGWASNQLNAFAADSSTLLQFGFQNDPSYLGLDDISVIPVPPAVFQTTLQTNGSVFLVWSTLPGVNYLLQYTTDLSLPNWINLQGPTRAADTTMSASDPIGPDPQRFYRVVLSP
jgi:hypothetical protein